MRLTFIEISVLMEFIINPNKLFLLLRFPTHFVHTSASTYLFHNNYLTVTLMHISEYYFHMINKSNRNKITCIYCTSPKKLKSIFYHLLKRNKLSNKIKSCSTNNSDNVGQFSKFSSSSFTFYLCNLNHNFIFSDQIRKADSFFITHIPIGIFT